MIPRINIALHGGLKDRFREDKKNSFLQSSHDASLPSTVFTVANYYWFFVFHVCHYCGLILILTFYVAIGREETKIKLSFSYVLGTSKEFNKINSIY